MKPSAILLLVSALLSGCASSRAYRSARDGLLDDTGERSFARRGHKLREPVIDLDAAKAVRGEVEQVGFRWPLSHVEVTSSFGKRGEEMHEGVDLRASNGTAVFASASGTVLYSGNQIRGYGKLVVLRHPNGLSSIYAHNSKLLVIKGQKVKRGQELARSGHSGHVSGPHVHFEIRKGVTPMDPERAISRSLVALPSNSLKAARVGRLASSDLTRNDSGKPPVTGLKHKKHFQTRRVAYRPAKVRRAKLKKAKQARSETYPATSETNE